MGRRAKSTPRKSSPAGAPARLPALTEVGRQIMAHVFNSMALGNYEQCCGVEDIARFLGKTPGRLMPIVRRLVDQGYLTLQGELYPIIQPTVAALRSQDPSLTDEAGRALLRRMKG